ncbi:MAG TPA: MazG family protein [Actinomycetota bacterium]|nr:MazG family protein [Actinomycetota bacterium]
MEQVSPADPIRGPVAVGPAAVRGAEAFARLVAVMARLRGPGGCPWDAEQDHTSLAIHLLEETHEVLDAIDRGDLVELREELGDLLLQIVFHAQMAAEVGAFEIGDVVEDLTAKLIHRHPHVFGSVSVSGAGEVVANWEALKHEQKQRASLGEGIPTRLPALLYAHKVLRRLSGAGLGPEVPEGRLASLLAAAAAAKPGPETRAETDMLFGEVLYGISALALRAGVDPEGALRRVATRNLSAADAARAAGGPDPEP